MRLSQLLAVPSMRRLLVPAEPVRDNLVRSVLLVEDFEDLARSPAESVAVLTRHAALSLRGERFDAALRRSAEQGVVAVVHDGAAPLSPAGSTIARHGGVTLVRARDGVTSGEIVQATDRELGGGALAALHRGSRALGELREAEMLRCPESELIKTVADALGLTLSTSEHAQGGCCVPVRVDGDVREWISAGAAGDPLNRVADLVLESLAAAVARSAERRHRAEAAPSRSPGQVLTELLSGDLTRDVELVARARAAGLPVEGWHVVAHLEVENLSTASNGDELLASGLLRDIASIALQRVRSVHPDWHRALSVTGVTLVRMFRVAPGEQATTLTAAVVGGALARVLERHPQLRIRCGVGSPHSGPIGLVRSYAEARTALAEARHTSRVNAPVVFEPTGLRRTLADWYHDSTSRYAVQSVLDPLDSLGSRSTEAVRTLQVYLDNRGSLARTAELLHLHRNSVAYRLKRIFELLTVDPEDPDDRLLLQLACRARLMR
ncbi:MAG TPA: helix-turn-helix domain-containing protein [Mycobacteriales bacterium]|nr:helix-turn-helix domain-containing protein [Mycobacteriales bacterium]